MAERETSNRCGVGYIHLLAYLDGSLQVYETPDFISIISKCGSFPLSLDFSLDVGVR